MRCATWLALLLTAAIILSSVLPSPAPGCCPVPPSGKPVVNANQTVIIIWDPASKTQHFIRQASFKSEADDFGFLIPTPTQPELDESGNEAFPYLRKLTEPEKQKVPRPSGGMGCGCGASPMAIATKSSVEVLQDKLVAGFRAVVLETRSADNLVGWLKDHGYAYSPEVKAWASPYVAAGWKITALKVAKDKDPQHKTITASSLRMSFKTDRPLFPYREPDSRSFAADLNAKNRLLRIYFISEGRYRGELAQDIPWTGNVAWANKVASSDRNKVLEALKLPDSTGPSEWWLTEFEDDWPYRVAPADVYFSPDIDQNTVKRPPIVEYVSSSGLPDVTVFAMGAVVGLPLVLRWMRGSR